jgi:hypothetical protein
VYKSIGWIALACLAAGCSGRRAEEQERARLAQIDADGRALDEAADNLESRLLADKAQVTLWKELAERHKHVSAIATENANTHLEGIERFISRQDEKMRAMKHRRIASAELFDTGDDTQRVSTRRTVKRRN